MAGRRSLFALLEGEQRPRTASATSVTINETDGNDTERRTPANNEQRATSNEHATHHPHDQGVPPLPGAGASGSGDRVVRTEAGASGRAARPAPARAGAGELFGLLRPRAQ